MPGPRHKPAVTDRERARQTLTLRIEGQSYQAIAAALGYRDESGARHAVDRLLARAEADGVAKLRTVEGRRLDEMQAAIWDKAERGNLGAIREVIRIMERRARLFGADCPIAVAVGISESEFARQAAELLQVTGDGPLRELARLSEPPGEPIVVDAHLDGWANIYAEPQAESDHADEPEPVVVEDIETEPEPAPVVVERVDAEPGAPDEAEVIEADLLPLPPSQRRLAASEVLDGNGVPIGRSGVARRLGGYNPLTAWRP